MKKLIGSFVLVFVALISFHCQKELSGPGVPGNNNNSNPVTVSLQGNIVDENGLPAAGVLVRAGSKTMMTDAKGYFRIIKAPLDKNNSVVTAEKSGYFKSYRVFAATSGANHISIKLVKRNLAGTIATGGGEVTLANGAKIQLPANAVKLASGGTYSGSINVFASYIDPTSSDIASTVPGSFLGTDLNNNRVVLTSFGMFAVELESPAGEKLQLATGIKATLSAPIPATLRAAAPATIPLWYVDEQTGIWKEEGIATRSGDSYSGQVSHFSFWNYDAPASMVNLSLTLKDNKSTPLVHVPVRLTRTNGLTFPAQGYTDSLGQVCGYVYSNETLLLEVLDPCGNAVYSQTVGPFTQNTNLGVITVNNSSTSFVTIKGKLVNCTGGNVTNGYAIIDYNNSAYRVNVNATGDFSLVITRCAASPLTCDVTGVDNVTQQQSSVTNVTIVSPDTNVGTLTACGVSSAQYFNYTLNGTNYSVTSANNDSLMGYTFNQSTPPQTWLNGSQIPNFNNNISLEFKSPAAAGVYPVTSLSVNNFSRPFLIQPFNVTITSFPVSSGGFYEGSFSGQFRDSIQLTPIHTVSGVFRIRK